MLKHPAGYVRIVALRRAVVRQNNQITWHGTDQCSELQDGGKQDLPPGTMGANNDSDLSIAIRWRVQFSL